VLAKDGRWEDAELINGVGLATVGGVFDGDPGVRRGGNVSGDGSDGAKKGGFEVVRVVGLGDVTMGADKGGGN